VIPQYAIAAGIGALVVVTALAGWLLWRRRRGPEVAKALSAVAIERLENVLLPDGMGGHIQVEHLLLTGHGLVVIDAKPFVGTIFASERMADWTVIGKQGRFTFPNPLGTLYDRVAALRQLVREVPVNGHVLFASAADFTKGRPRDVLSAAELVELYRRPEQADLERLLVAFAPHWERVKSAIEPAP
jgi:hypothetical protein